jgi:antitoxin (DNA-binding transcriptional repressor) of toxin-antitoxin stability system
VARLVPFRARTLPRVPGGWRDQIAIADDFDAPNEEIADLFER